MATTRAFQPQQDFLRVPPFPGARVSSLKLAQTLVDLPSRSALYDALRAHRVGGNYWKSPPDGPGRGVMVRAPRLSGVAEAIAADLGVDIDCRPMPSRGDDVDPWSLLEQCSAVVCEPDDPARYVAALLDLPVFTDASGVADEKALDELGDWVGSAFIGPFDEEPISPLTAIALCGFWRTLVESNRDVVGALGFAFWKQDNVQPLLWDGGAQLPFWRKPPYKVPPGSVAVWRSRASPNDIRRLEDANVALVEVEDGFLRSAGLGADCVPPMSITVDRHGPYFDPSQPSELELLLQNETFDAEMLDRARRLRSLIVEAGLGKYERGTKTLPRFDDRRRHLLVPGQVEDDRSVLTGGGGLTNVELLRLVRRANPDALIIYKPHPDVEAGHRRGVVTPNDAAGLVDRIVDDASIASLLDLADEVHVNTSLAGFEGLLRGKPVTTYGVPFYAGWGLTSDVGPVPTSRSRRRTLDELVAAALLVYPRYLDPESRLPCPAETVVRRLVSDQTPQTGVVVRLRRWQGRIVRQLRMLMG